MIYPTWFQQYRPYKDFNSSFNVRFEEWVKRLDPRTDCAYIARYRDVLLEQYYHSGEPERQGMFFYIRTIDEFENEGWLEEYFRFRYESLRHCYLCLQTLEYNRKYHRWQNTNIGISEKLSDAIAYECDAIEYVRNSIQAQKVAFAILKGLELSNYKVWKYHHDVMKDLNVLCEWLQRNWINPQKYESLIKSIFESPDIVLYRESIRNGKLILINDMEKRQLLSAFKNNQSFYIRMVDVFDAYIKRHNIAAFNYYKDENHDPSGFCAVTFANGSRMRPVRRWFSWRLE